MTAVLDANIAAKWFFPEEGSAEATALLQTGIPIIAPDIIIPETCNIAWKKHRLGQAPALDVETVASKLPKVFDIIYESASLADRAVEIAIALDHPVYDCFYLAAAERAATTLITADGRLIARVRGTAWDAWVRPLR